MLFLFKNLVLHYGGDYILAYTATYIENFRHISKNVYLVVFCSFCSIPATITIFKVDVSWTLFRYPVSSSCKSTSDFKRSASLALKRGKKDQRLPWLYTDRNVPQCECHTCNLHDSLVYSASCLTELLKPCSKNFSTKYSVIAFNVQGHFFPFYESSNRTWRI